MTTFLPKEIQAGLDQARARDLAKRSRLRVEMDGATYNILKFSSKGFALSSDVAPHLRGLVDVYDGSRQLYQCLVVASQEEDGQMWYEYKRSTVVSDRPPLDYVRGPHAPAGLLTDKR